MTEKIMRNNNDERECALALDILQDTLKSNHNISDLSGSSGGNSQEVVIAFKANIFRYEMRMLFCFLVLDERI